MARRAGRREHRQLHVDVVRGHRAGARCGGGESADPGGGGAGAGDAGVSGAKVVGRCDVRRVALARADRWTELISPSWHGVVAPPASIRDDCFQR